MNIFFKQKEINIYSINKQKNLAGVKLIKFNDLCKVNKILGFNDILKII